MNFYRAIPVTDLSNLKLFATHPHPCSYLEDQESTTIFLDPAITIDATLYSQLSELGFRRSGHHIYRPRCHGCQACIPIRIPVKYFKPSRNQMRCAKRNGDLSMDVVSSIDTDEHYDLYKRYINLRHSDGDMYPPSRSQYTDFLSAEWGVTHYIEFRCESSQLVAVAVTDKLDNGLSAIYTFFDPAQSKRSLGVFSVLFQISWARKMKLPYVYLGYWIKNCKKMTYKIDYQPCQLLINGGWVSIPT